MIYIMQPDEKECAIMLAKEARSHYIKREGKGDRDDYGRDNRAGGLLRRVVGMFGEIAVRRILGIDEDPKPFCDGGVDVTLWNGLTISVKACEYHYGNLITYPHEKDQWRKYIHRMQTNFAVLACGECAGGRACNCETRLFDAEPYEIDIVGFIECGIFVRECEREGPPKWKSKTYIFPRGKLKPIEGLLTIEGGSR